MKQSLLIISCLFCTLGIVYAMDKELENDDVVLDETAFQPDTKQAAFHYTFPELTVAHMYPIQLYNPKAHKNATVRRQFCLKKKYGSRYGKFFIYTAVDKKKWLENPGYCLSRIAQENVAKREHEKEVGYNYGKLFTHTYKNGGSFTYALARQKADNDKYLLWHEQDFMSLEEENICDATLARCIDCFRHKHAIFVIGRCITRVYRVYPEVQQEGCALKLDTQKVRRISPFLFIQHDYLHFNTDHFDTKEVYQEWPEHSSKQLLRAALDEREGVPAEFEPIEFTYGASPSSSPESSGAFMLDVQLQARNTKTRKYQIT